MKKKHPILRTIVSVLILLIVSVAGFLYWAIGTSLPEWSKLKTVVRTKERLVLPKDTISVLTYNIGHGQGVKDLPWDWRGEEITKLQLRDLGDVLRRIDADVVLLQEVDLNSNRTHYINEAEFLVEEAGYPYYACANVWDKNYVPFPFWPPKYHIGRVVSADCIFSKYPLKNHERLIFDKPESNSFWYNWGYLDRAAQKVEVEVGDKKVTVFNIHFEAWDDSAREKQVKRLLDWTDKISGPIIVGGDFNAVPPESSVKKYFADEPDIDLSEDDTIAIMRSHNPDFSQAISISSYIENENNFMTYPADAPTRKLDYLFAFGGAKVIKGRIAKEAGTASDHLPVWAEVKIKVD